MSSSTNGAGSSESEVQESNSGDGASEKRAGLLFYQSVVPLRRDKHADLMVKKEADYRFSAQANALPIIISEFVAAQLHYPIFFSSEEIPVPLVATGPYNERRNVHVSADGKWTANAYVPLYVRRYPFIFISAERPPDDKREQAPQVLAFDEKASLFTKSAKDGVKLFEGKEGQKPVDMAMAICQQFFVAGLATQDFTRALVEHDLLDWQSLARRDINDKNKKDETLFSFRAVNPEKISKLEDDVVIDFFRKGYLAAIHAHLSSLQNWSKLALEL